ncbi:hypothetical protein KY385_01615 [Candidatus Parcubacteria bacterium]|nr:hypothetical protein [Candidatus Parcubacteria bacterium]
MSIEDGPSRENPAFIAQPDGSFVGINEQRRKNHEAEMDVSVLQAGDVLAARFDNEDSPSGFVYEVEEAVWHDLGISNYSKPGRSLSGRINSASLPSEINGTEKVIFTGSTYGGSIISPGLIATGMYPEFFLKGKGRLTFPPINYFVVFRADERGSLQEIEPQQLVAETSAKNEKHTKRVAEMDQVIEAFRFDRNLRNLGGQTYSDERYEAVFDSRGAVGLAILDKKTKVWMKYQYDEGRALQIGFAKLSDIKEAYGLDGRFSSTVEPIYRAGVAISTHTTSPRYGIDVVNYKMSKKEAADIDFAGKDAFPPSPNIRVWPDGSHDIDDDSYKTSDEKRIEDNKKIEEVLELHTAMDSTGRVLIIDGEPIELFDPSTEAEKIIKQLSIDTEQQSQWSERKIYTSGFVTRAINKITKKT